MQEFLEARTKKQFQDLRANKHDERENMIDFSTLPNHVFGHP
jgi:hypothetical protein